MRLFSKPKTILMYRSHLKVFLNIFLRNKLLSLINLTGLVIGFIVVLLIWQFVAHELSYDSSKDQYQRVFRIIRNWQGGERYGTDITAPMAGALVGSFPEILAATRCVGSPENKVIKELEVFREESVLAVDSSFLTVFGLELLSGQSGQALNTPNTVIISESASRRYFGVEDPVGELLRFECSRFGTDSKEISITGVFPDFPAKSHIRPDFLISSNTYKFIDNPSHFNHFLQTYVLLGSAAQRVEVESKLPGFLETYYGKEYNDYSNQTYLLQELRDIHLNTMVDRVSYETPKGNQSTVFFLPALALFVLIISVVNFINLHTSQSLSRAGEISVRKAFGADPGKEMRYFLFDSLLLFLVAYMLAICVIELVLPSFRSLTNRELDSNFYYNALNLAIIGAAVLFVGLLSGLVPAYSLVKRLSVRDRDNRLMVRGSGWLFNPGLIILQFTVCTVFLTVSLFIYKQFRYIDVRTSEGINKESVIIVKNPWYLGTSHAAFKERLRQHGDISGVTGSESVPGIDQFSTWGHPVDSALNDSHITVFYCDEEYASTLDLQVVQGRFLSSGFPTDNLAMVLNETAVETLGWDDPIGKKYRLDTVYHVVGVIRDMHFESLYEKVDPLGMVLIKPGTESFISVRATSGRIQEVMTYLHECWSEFVPDRPLDTTFMDREFDFWYRNDWRLGVITLVVAGLAILLSCMGLVGLMVFSILRRTKEVGIRKVNGAGPFDILKLFTGQTSRWIMIAFIISIPVTWFLVNRWLQDFAFRTSISWWIFPLAGLSVYLIALSSIIWQGLRASRQKAVDALRYE